MSDGNTQSKPKGGGRRRRSASRLAAVQVLYEIEVSGRSPALILPEFMAKGPVAELEGELLPTEPAYVEAIVRGVARGRADIDTMIASCLKDRSITRIDKVMLSILRAGAWELVGRGDVDTPVIISEYVGIAHAFFDGAEPSIVNGILDRLGRTVRAGVEGGDGDDPGLDLDAGQGADPDGPGTGTAG